MKFQFQGHGDSWVAVHLHTRRRVCCVTCSVIGGNITSVTRAALFPVLSVDSGPGGVKGWKGLGKVESVLSSGILAPGPQRCWFPLCFLGASEQQLLLPVLLEPSLHGWEFIFSLSNEGSYKKLLLCRGLPTATGFREVRPALPLQELLEHSELN